MIDELRSKARTSGAIFERQVEKYIRSFEVPCHYYVDFPEDKDFSQYFGLVKHVPYENLFKLPGKVEFILYLRGFTVRIECKVQNKPGSVIEKLPFAVETALQSPETLRVIIMHGSYYTYNHFSYMKKRAAERPGEVFIFNFPQFRAWFEKEIVPILDAVR